MTTQPDPETGEPEGADSAEGPGDSEQLEHSEELIDQAREAAQAALPDAGNDDLDAPSTSEGLPEDEPVTPGPN